MSEVNHPRSIFEDNIIKPDPDQIPPDTILVSGLCDSIQRLISHNNEIVGEIVKKTDALQTTVNQLVSQSCDQGPRSPKFSPSSPQRGHQSPNPEISPPSSKRKHFPLSVNTNVKKLKTNLHNLEEITIPFIQSVDSGFWMMVSKIPIQYESFPKFTRKDHLTICFSCIKLWIEYRLDSISILQKHGVLFFSKTSYIFFNPLNKLTGFIGVCDYLQGEYVKFIETEEIEAIRESLIHKDSGFHITTNIL